MNDFFILAFIKAKFLILSTYQTIVINTSTRNFLTKSISILVVYFLLGDSPASEIYMPTFRNTLSVPSS